jgi:hypothetical protein
VVDLARVRLTGKEDRHCETPCARQPVDPAQRDVPNACRRNRACVACARRGHRLARAAARGVPDAAPRLATAIADALEACAVARDATDAPRARASGREVDGAGARTHRRMERRMVTEFVFATGQYESGDWDSAPLVPANLIDSVARYTSLSVAPTGAIVALASDDLFRFPLVYLTGTCPFVHRSRAATCAAFVDRGGMLFVDDHNHDIDGAFHKTAVEELGGAGPLAQLPQHAPLYSAFFKFPTGRLTRRTS